jgi:hypothetical protein
VKPYGYTDQEIEDALAAREAFHKRVGTENVGKLADLVTKVADAFEAFMVVEDSVEFSPKEKNQVIDAIGKLKDTLTQHSARVSGWKPGMGKAAERKTKIAQ